MLNRAAKFGISIGRYGTKIFLAKNRKQLFPKCLSVLAMLLILATFLKVAAFGIDSISLGGRIEKAVNGFGQNDENVEKSVSKRLEAVKNLEQKNMFAPPAPKPKPPVCTGVLGDTAIMNGKACKVGQDIDGAKIVSIVPTEVMILWQGKEMKLPTFGADKVAPSAQRPVQKELKKREARPVEQTAVASNSMVLPEGAQVDFRNMSPEQREAYRRERRERGERGGSGNRGRPGGRGGPGDRPRDRGGPGDRPRDRGEPRER